ncbi:MAG: hypothetical protein JRF28_11010 [Deltaproteobacteria bacterium]|nr:hypothetical protein [Deltaproteobacteria bacterium]
MKLKWILLILGIFITVILYNVDPSENLFVPDEMAGRWASDSPKYKDRYLELSPVSVVYGTGVDTIDVNFVQSIEKQFEGGKTVYTIHYKSSTGEEGKISFFCNLSNNGEIRLKGQKEMTWKKIVQPFQADM